MLSSAFSQPPVDIHSHLNQGSALDAAQTPLHSNEPSFIRHSYRQLGIAWGGFSTFASVYHPMGQGVKEGNDWLYRFAAQQDWVRQWVVVEPRTPESFLQAQTMLQSAKTLGIKIHPVNHQYSLEEYGDAIFSFADALGAVVLMHPVMTPEGMEQAGHFADKYPNMKLILAHLCSQEHVELIRNARHGNLYTDTSGSASMMNRVLEYALERIGSEKILFGTDNYSAAAQLGRILLADADRADKENILYKNAMTLFPGAF